MYAYSQFILRFESNIIIYTLIHSSFCALNPIKLYKTHSPFILHAESQVTRK